MNHYLGVRKVYNRKIARKKLKVEYKTNRIFGINCKANFIILK